MSAAWAGPALALILWATMAGAVEPGEVLADPALEARARAIGRELRCLVCQNQSIDDSNAELARDLRRLVRERLSAGDSDAAATRYVVDRYGDFVLLRPPVKTSTYILWATPAIALLIGAAMAVVFFRRRRSWSQAQTPLSEQERHRVAELIRQGRKS